MPLLQLTQGASSSLWISVYAIQFLTRHVQGSCITLRGGDTEFILVNESPEEIAALCNKQ